MDLNKSSEVLDNSQPFVPSLNILPPEIREQIWLLSFSPRTIQLHVHYHKKDAKKKVPLSKRFTKPVASRSPRAKKVIGVSFTASLVKENEPPRFYRTVEEWNETQPSSGSCPTAPVILHVCRESRALALKRYRLSFPGTIYTTKSSNSKAVKSTFEKNWIRNQLGENRIWFDFERDLLLLHQPYDFISTYMNFEALDSVVRYANAEIQSIRNLGIGIWTPGWRMPSQGYSNKQDVMDNLGKFTKLKRLAAYDISNRPSKSLTTVNGPTTWPSSLVRIKRYVTSTLRERTDLTDARQSTVAFRMPSIQFLSAEGTILSQIRR